MDISLTDTWHSLSKHQKKIADQRILDQFTTNPNRVNDFSCKSCGLLLDYSKNHITKKTVSLLHELASRANLLQQIENMFCGELINTTEDRAVLHHALRNLDPDAKPIYINHQNIFPQIRQVLAAIETCANSIRQDKWLGFTNQPITDVVNLGIGGSQLGPKMVTKALAPYHGSCAPKLHFVSNIDPTDIAETLNKLDPTTTLFIIASKTFTTPETLANAKIAKEWLITMASSSTATATSADPNQSKEIIKRHFIAVTANFQHAHDFGIAPSNILPFWDWVGGRFSLWSAIGLPIAIAIGSENFRLLLQGAHAMDRHFLNTSFHNNMPVILALLSIWNINFCNTKAQAITPYDQYLEYLPTYLQQLEMESNGKMVTSSGVAVNYATAPVILGDVGTNGQHAFHQLLLQGTQVVPVDFIVSRQSHNPIGDNHLALYANCIAQAQALMQGRNEPEIIAELIATGMNNTTARKLAPHKVISGNIPSNIIVMEKLTPQTLGSLLALYEHKIFVQGAIWQINSFDQWGVELGKNLAKQIIPYLKEQSIANTIDDSTRNLIKIFKDGLDS